MLRGVHLNGCFIMRKREDSCCFLISTLGPQNVLTEEEVKSYGILESENRVLKGKALEEALEAIGEKTSGRKNEGENMETEESLNKKIAHIKSRTTTMEKRKQVLTRRRDQLQSLLQQRKKQID